MTPDLVLLDVMMPEVDGFETCRRLKGEASLADVPVVREYCRLTQAERRLQVEDLLSLAPGETFSTPWLECAASSRGLNGVSQAFHASIRSPATSSPSCWRT